MAAGLGFKTFTTGEVLTAADTNGYLMQGVLVFASAAARDAAITSPQEGQCCYLKDTDAVLTYSGSAWVGFDDSNAIQNSIVDAKGDLVAASGADTPARLAVGSNGETLVADSSTSTGLRYQALFGANKNKIINGDFYINQRAFTSNTTNASFNFDRWSQVNSGGTFTLTPQTFTPGAAPVAGYEGKTYLQGITASQSAAGDYAIFDQKIEDVRNFAGQTVTVSFWAKAATGTPKIAIEIGQVFGTGGSASVFTAGGAVTLSTSWARYSVSVAVPSVSGKTITTGNDSCLELLLWVSAGTSFASRASSIGIQNGTFSIWGVQVEAGSVATAFQTATGTLQGELAACQRYYYRQTADGDAYQNFGFGMVTNTTTAARIQISNPVTMRSKPSSIDFTSLRTTDYAAGFAVSALTFGETGIYTTWLTVTMAAGTAFRSVALSANNTTAAYVGINAEL